MTRSRPDNFSWSDEKAMEMFRAGHLYKTIAGTFNVLCAYVRHRIVDCRLAEIERRQAALEGRIRFLEAKANGEELARVQADGFVMPKVDDVIINLYRGGVRPKEISLKMRSSEGQVLQVLTRAKLQGLLNGTAHD